ncbi:uncharacterized protein LOC115887999 isoform X2 [Sitophilus oryzae]|uniref:Uncharacterized protein LOC115887999 isoform X2 n=1 Tax=Sitophilus oryzae TaxID=7048 RepID=A0A6J2YJW3_SITOR|nr:uncharacterized protein LOC115887999 isoform X2 [Sitophilus oryzae]
MRERNLCRRNRGICWGNYCYKSTNRTICKYYGGHQKTLNGMKLVQKKSRKTILNCCYLIAIRTHPVPYQWYMLGQLLLKIHKPYYLQILWW